MSGGSKDPPMQLDRCGICELPARNIEYDAGASAHRLECSRCGLFAIGSYVAQDFKGNPRQVANASSYLRQHQGITISDEDVPWLKSLPTPTVTEKCINLLRGIATEYPKAGARVPLSLNHLPDQLRFALSEFSYPSEDTAFENVVFNMFRWLGYAAAEDADELTFLVDTVLVPELGYLAREDVASKRQYKITGAGWQVLADLESKGTASDVAFVGMSFHPALTPVYRTAIQPAINSAGYKVERLDHTRHNEEIVHKILADIRRAHFVVVDLTTQNQGAYFEAGYAMGLGRPVIRTVRKDELKAVHFDQKHYNCLLWEPEKLPQFRFELQQWIEATVGRGPVVQNNNDRTMR
jgi:nucleoside 2-deoxyribosyltransferase